MRNLIQILVTFLLLLSCSTASKKNQKFYLTTLNNFGFLLSKSDSIQIRKFQRENKKFADSCEKYKLNCILDGGYTGTEFKGGINNFRKLIYENFNLPKKSLESTNRIYVIIGKNDKIKSFRIENTKDESVKKELIRIMNLKEINNWKSGSFNRYKLESFVELDLIIEKK